MLLINIEPQDDTVTSIVEPADDAQEESRSSYFTVSEANELIACVAKIYEGAKHAKSQISKQALWDSAYNEVVSKHPQRNKKSLQVIIETLHVQYIFVFQQEDTPAVVLEPAGLPHEEVQGYR